MDAQDASAVQWSGYFPGVVGKVVELHAVYYNVHWGFDVSFETQVGRELSEFLARLDDRRDGFWSVRFHGRFAGSIAIDGLNSADDGARLRWMIVDPLFHRQGIARGLIRRALDFCRSARHPAVVLYTFAGLNSARQLYESEGFELVHECRAEQWGTSIIEQEFRLQL